LSSKIVINFVVINFVGEISGICKTRIQQQQTAAAEFGTFLLKTAMEANGAQNSPSETSLGP
jgi:hypothetical protein